MAPVTRSQTRNRLGEFAKYVLEQPTIMGNIIQNLNNSDVKETYSDLCNLRLVFKSERTVDVINSHYNRIRKMYIQRMRVDSFKTDLKEMLEKVEKDNEKDFVMILDYIMDHLDVMKMSCMERFRDAVYLKVMEYYNFNSQDGLKYVVQFSKIY